MAQDIESTHHQLQLALDMLRAAEEELQRKDEQLDITSSMLSATERELQLKEEQLTLTAAMLRRAESAIRRQAPLQDVPLSSPPRRSAAAATTAPVAGTPAVPQPAPALGEEPVSTAPPLIVPQETQLTLIDAKLPVAVVCDRAASDARVAVQVGPGSALTRPVRTAGQPPRQQVRAGAIMPPPAVAAPAAATAPRVVFAATNPGPAGRGGLRELANMSERANLIKGQAQLVQADSIASMEPKSTMRCARSLVDYINIHEANPRLPFSHVPFVHAFAPSVPPVAR